jgi:hypothetical protein
MNSDKQLTDYREDELIPASAMPGLFPGTTAQTWNSLRFRGNGPAYIKVMRRVYYRRRDVEAWLDGNRWARTDLPAS